MYQLRSYPANMTGRLDRILRASRIVSKHATATEARQERARLELKYLDRVYFVTDELGNLGPVGEAENQTVKIVSDDPLALFRACSGQARRRGGNNWGICLIDGKGPAWWRAKYRDGRFRLFRDYEAAQAYTDRLNADPSLAFPRLRIITCRKVELADEE